MGAKIFLRYSTAKDIVFEKKADVIFDISRFLCLQFVHFVKLVTSFALILFKV